MIGCFVCFVENAAADMGGGWKIKAGRLKFVFQTAFAANLCCGLR
ncbi:hypothetical protein [Kingella potus]|nr:hypothetical protein [Kingella potus]